MVADGAIINDTVVEKTKYVTINYIGSKKFNKNTGWRGIPDS
jgi:hypothetical protein